MIVQVVMYRSRLGDAEVLGVIEARAPQYRDLPGLLQKVYIRNPESGEYGGIYIWDNKKSMQEFRGSELARTIPTAYQVEGDPTVEIFEVTSVLRSSDLTLPPA